MRIGDVVISTKIEARHGGIAKPSMRVNFKANPGHALVFLMLGTVSEGQDQNAHAERMLRAIGWDPLPVLEGEDAGIDAAFAAQQKEQAK